MESENKPKRQPYSIEQTIDSLISAPLVAASKANANMLTGQVRFLIENCFTKQADGSYQPIFITMTLQSASVNTSNGFSISNPVMQFQVPIISLLPLNSLVVDSLKIDFGLDITSVRRGKSRDERRKTGSLMAGTIRNTAVLSGKIAETENSTGKKGPCPNDGMHIKMSIEVKAQALPKGTQTLLDIYTKAITPTNPSTPEKEDA
jgi:hypothetical protein